MSRGNFDNKPLDKSEWEAMVWAMYPGKENREKRTEMLAKGVPQQPQFEQPQNPTHLSSGKSATSNSQSFPKSKIYIYGFLLIVIFLFPPWVSTYQRPGMSKVYQPAGYAFLATPPSTNNNARFRGVTLDVSRITLEILILITIISIDIFTRKLTQMELPSNDSKVQNKSITTILRYFSPPAKPFWIFATVSGSALFILIWITRFVYHKEGRELFRTNRWTSKVEILDQNAGVWLPGESNNTSSPQPAVNDQLMPFPPGTTIRVGQIKSSNPTVYTYTDENGRMIINNLPPTYFESMGYKIVYLETSGLKQK